MQSAQYDEQRRLTHLLTVEALADEIIEAYERRELNARIEGVCAAFRGVQAKITSGTDYEEDYCAFNSSSGCAPSG